MKAIKILLLLVVFFMLAANFVLSKVVKVFPELLNPDAVYVDDQHIIITEGVTINLFRLKNFELIKKFGKEGEGPQEFKKRINWIGFRENDFYVASEGKISYFTKNGEFIKEVRAVSPTGWGFQPLGDELFIGAGARRDEKVSYRTVNIYNKNLEKVKELVSLVDARAGKGIHMFGAPFNFASADDKVFVAASKDFIIEVFDNKGNKLLTIKQDYEKMKVPDEAIQAVYNWYKRNPSTKHRFEYYKKALIFPEYLPAIRYIDICDKKIYARTFKKVDGKTETFIFDMKGKLLKKAFLPVYEENMVEYYSVSVKNGNMYQLIENQETEKWELHVTKIE